MTVADIEVVLRMLNKTPNQVCRQASQLHSLNVQLYKNVFCGSLPR